MLRQGYVRTAILLIGGLGVLALAARADSAKPLRPAATGPSPEEAQLKQLPAPAQQVGRPAKADLVSRCQQRPACRAKLEMAQKGQKSATPRPAASSPSPEEQEFRKLPPPAQPVTPRRFQQSGPGPWPWDRLLAWLNPFRPPVAEAQAGFSVYLTPRDHLVVSYGYLSIWGSVMHGTTYLGTYILYPNYTTPARSVENKPFVETSFQVPATSWYIIDVRASNASTKLYHYPSQSVIETWPAGSVPCAGFVCDYVTAEYLQQGSHYFYFYSPTNSYSFHSVSIESYP